MVVMEVMAVELDDCYSGTGNETTIFTGERVSVLGLHDTKDEKRRPFPVDVRLYQQELLRFCSLRASFPKTTCTISNFRHYTHVRMSSISIFFRGTGHAEIDPGKMKNDRDQSESNDESDNEV